MFVDPKGTWRDGFIHSFLRLYSRFCLYLDTFLFYANQEIQAPISWVILLILFTWFMTTLITGNQFEYHPESNLCNFIRLCFNIIDCFWRLLYNIYHCRLNEIPSFVSAVHVDDDDDKTTGIARALEVEHKKRMMKMTGGG